MVRWEAIVDVQRGQAGARGVQLWDTERIQFRVLSIPNQSYFPISVSVASDNSIAWFFGNSSQAFRSRSYDLILAGPLPIRSSYLGGTWGTLRLAALLPRSTRVPSYLTGNE